MSTSVLRRYTPPTCTLEIAATGSALSRWTDRTVLKNLRFHLSFDDPKIPSDQQITIRGDRTQLEALCETVEAYVQALLNRSAADPIPMLAPVAGEPREDTLTQPESVPAVVEGTPKMGIRLQPIGLLFHELHLGSLATENLGKTVRLSALQLFDLANALDSYHAEALTLPALGRPRWMKSPAGWASIAAVFLLAVGATGAVTKFVLDVSSSSPQVASKEADADSELEVSSIPNPATQSALPVPSGNSPTNLQLEPLLPPKPPAGAIQPAPSSSAVGVPVPVPQQQPIQPITPSADVPAAAAPDIFVVPAPGEVASSEPTGTSGSTSAAAPADPTLLADAPPPDAITSTTNLPSFSSSDYSVAANGESARQAGTPSEAEATAGTQTGTQTAANPTMFDRYPQIAEVRNYFAQNWQPPEELNQTLEYRLLLSQNGTIQLIVPLGDASAQYIDRTNMPLMGEPFVSPLQNRSDLQVRLVLNPDGRVQTFADGN